MFLVRYQFAISSQAPIIWNEIPLSIRNSPTTANFKKEPKLYFLSLNRISTGFSQFIVSLGKVHLIWQGGGMKILKLEAWNFSSPPR